MLLVKALNLMSHISNIKAWNAGITWEENLSFGLWSVRNSAIGVISHIIVKELQEFGLLTLQTCLLFLEKCVCLPWEGHSFSATAVTQTSNMSTGRLQHQIWSWLTLSNRKRFTRTQHGRTGSGLLFTGLLQLTAAWGGRVINSVQHWKRHILLEEILWLLLYLLT